MQTTSCGAGVPMVMTSFGPNEECGVAHVCASAHVRLRSAYQLAVNKACADTLSSSLDATRIGAASKEDRRPLAIARVDRILACQTYSPRGEAGAPLACGASLRQLANKDFGVTPKARRTEWLKWVESG